MKHISEVVEDDFGRHVFFSLRAQMFGFSVT